MLEIILLIFLTKKIGALAVRKGLPSTKWKWITVGAWIGFEILGVVIGVLVFGEGNLVGLMMFGLASAFGGYLAVKYTLDKKPDNSMDDDINRIGSNDLRP